MYKRIINELKHHAPFTMLGAGTGILLMIICRKLPENISFNIFYIFHPLHVVLSAIVTASMYEIHKQGKSNSGFNLLALLLIGYIGSVGIATLSDSLIPYLGEVLLNMPNRHMHIGFIEKWWIVNPLALLGIVIAYFRPSTKLPHSGHVLLSTWASLFHILMAASSKLSIFSYFFVFVFLFLAVWLPCCISDVVFPLLFVRERPQPDK